MIVSLEGPDCSGKSTLFHALQSSGLNATFVPSLPATKAIMSVIGDVAVYTERLWRRLYDPSKLYVVDRHMVLSTIVYARLYGRPMPQFDNFWTRQTYMLYMDVPIEVLKRRHTVVNDQLFDVERYGKLKLLYESEIRKYQYIRLDGTRPVADLVRDILPILETM